jgi:hypothetical protein
MLRILPTSQLPRRQGFGVLQAKCSRSYAPARLGAVEQRELTGLLWPTQAGIVAVRFTAGKRRRATKRKAATLEVTLNIVIILILQTSNHLVKERVVIDLALTFNDVCNYCKVTNIIFIQL